MVQEYQSPVRVYKFPFEMVMVAYERRFPRCPQIPVVLGCVVTEDSWSQDHSTRRTTRRCQLNVDAPYLIKKMIGVDHVYFIQKNHLDLKSQVLQIEATNETFSNRVEVQEQCKYYVHPENPEWTCFEQSALLDVKSFFGLENAIEKIAMKQYSANIAKGKEIIDVFMRDVRAEGVTSVPAWREGAFDENERLRQLLAREEPVAPLTSVPRQVAATAASAAPLPDGAPTGTSIGEYSQSTSFHNYNSTSNDNYLRQCSGMRHTTILITKEISSIILHQQDLEFEDLPDPSQEDKYQLDSEYIKRYLGELTVMQESRLLQLRKWVAELQKGKVPSDTTLLRFLRARDFHVERAREMLSQSLLWRKRHQVDRILSEYETPRVVCDYFPGGWHHHDKDGRPLYVLRLGQMDVKGLLKSIGEDGLLKLTLHVCEEGLNLLSEATQTSGRAIQSWSLLVDLDGLNMRHLWRPGVRALLRIIQIVETNYPETMGRVLIVRAPRVFPILWTIVSTFIDENTRSKFLFYGGKDYLQTPGGLVDYIPKDLIPDFLGGPCKSFVHEGGLVPKNLYASGVFMERSDSDPLSEDSIYHSVSLAKGQMHEVIVNNDDPSSVLTWDFDVMRQDIAFTVYRTNMELMGSEDSNVGGLCSMSSGEQEHPHQRSVLDKSWQEGRHYHRVEPTIICHDGESIQGSHVMMERASYILQWRWHSGGAAHGTGGPTTADLLDSLTLTAHRAQLMYFYEILTSHDYKGSMSSLQSGNSGFSILSSKSATSSCPSR